MDFDLNQFDTEIAHYDALHAKEGEGRIALGAKQLATKITGAIVGLLPDINKNMPKHELDNIERLCEKMVEFKPTSLSCQLLQGKFYCAIEDYQKAVDVFRKIYEVQKDEKEYPAWPHLQKMDINVALLDWFVPALSKAGKNDEAQAFNRTRLKWQGGQPSGPAANGPT